MSVPLIPLLPKMVQGMASEVVELLDPKFVFKNLLSINDNIILLQGKRFEVVGKVHLFAAGKAASYELKAFKEILSQSSLKSKIGKCVSLTKDGHTVEDPDIVELEGTHPVVTEKNLEMTRRFIDQLKEVSEQDTLVFLLSGGASALMEMPKEGMSFEELKAEHTRVLNSGMNINEMNRVRKSLSQVKDGGLLTFIPTEKIIQFITCDIPNENLPDVSSGPLLGQDKTKHPPTFKTQSATKLLDSFCDNEPRRVRGEIFDCVLEEMEEKLLKALPEADEILVSGGEATIQVPPKAGKGGRNTHFVLSFAQKIYQDKPRSVRRI